MDGVAVRIYDREKTVADCFKYRRLLGMDIVLDALKDYMRQPDRDVNRLLEYAGIDRVEKTILPYLETLS